MKKPIVELQRMLLKLNPTEFTLLSVIIGYILSDGLTALEIESIGNFMFSIGQTMSTIGTQMQNLESKYEIQNEDLLNMINILKNKIGNFERIITDLNKLN